MALGNGGCGRGKPAYFAVCLVYFSRTGQMELFLGKRKFCSLNGRTALLDYIKMETRKGMGPVTHTEYIFRTGRKDYRSFLRKENSVNKNIPISMGKNPRNCHTLGTSLMIRKANKRVNAGPIEFNAVAFVMGIL
jgi:hypothetical protein